MGTVVCKYTQKFLNEEEILEEIEENERLELNKNKEVDEEFEESEILEKNESEYGIGEITTDQINEKKIEKNKKVENDSVFFLI